MTKIDLLLQNNVLCLNDQQIYQPIFGFYQDIYRFQPKRTILSASVGVDNCSYIPHISRQLVQESTIKQVRQLSCSNVSTVVAFL